MLEEKPDALFEFESGSDWKEETKNNGDEKFDLSSSNAKTNRASSETDCGVETAGLTWHQTKAEFELVAHNSTQDYFTYQESLSIYTFLLDEIRSQNPKRLGRVAKRRVETSDGKLWSRYKKNYCGRREIGAYRGHFRSMSGKIHDFPGLSDTEKLDLYYALGIKVPKQVRQRLIDSYSVEIDDKGIITNSSKMNHWDVVHSDSDREDDDDDVSQKKRKIKWLRFSEREDGVLWEYLLDYVNEYGQKPPVVTKKFWEEFKEKYEGQSSSWERVPETYRGRYFKFLAPNLHLMPFDIETKAALFQTMEIVVHKDFRKELIEATGVTLDAEGLVTSYEKRPESLVLQSKHYESVIGISSANRVSILRNPHTCDQDTVPYTEQEEKQIWEFMRQKLMGPKGKPVRIRQKLTGMILWREFQSSVKTKRFTRSLNQHFNEEMIRNILSTDYDFKTQLELLFALDVPLEDDEVNYIRQKTYTLHLNTKGAIRYVAGEGFIIGKSLETPLKISKKVLKEMVLFGKPFGSAMNNTAEQKFVGDVKLENFYENQQKPAKLGNPSLSRNVDEIRKPVVRKRGALIMPMEQELDEDELEKLGKTVLSNNSAKFPYLPYSQRHKNPKPPSLNLDGTPSRRGRKPIYDQFTTISPPEKPKPSIYIDTKPENFLDFGNTNEDSVENITDNVKEEYSNVDEMEEKKLESTNFRKREHKSGELDNEERLSEKMITSEELLSTFKEVIKEVYSLAGNLETAQTRTPEKQMISKRINNMANYFTTRVQQALFDE